MTAPGGDAPDDLARETFDEKSPLGAAVAAAEAAPEDEAPWELLEQAAIAAGRPAVALGAYQRTLATEIPMAAGVALGRRAVAFQVEWLADRPRVQEEILERVLAIDPRCDWALRQLIVALTLAQRWDALLAVYDRALAAGPDRERRVALLSEAAQVAKDFVGRQELAITYLQQLFTLAPGDGQVATVLERLLERHERWAELVALWRARAGMVPPGEGRALRERVALAELERLKDPAAALQSLRALLGERGNQKRVLAALEEILAQDAAPDEARLGAQAALETAYDAAHEPEHALSAVESALRFATGAARRALLRKAAARRADAGDRRAAIAQLGALLPLAPDDREVEDWFRRLCHEEAVPATLVEGLAAAAAATSDGKRRADLRADVAAITDRALREPAAAIAAFQRAWREPDADAPTQRRTLLRLDELLEENDRPAERLPVLAAHADIAARPSERRELLGKRARLAAVLGEVNIAVASWRSCLELDGADAEALATLPLVLAGAGRWAEYVEILRHRMCATDDVRAQAADLGRAATAERDQLADRQAAILSFADNERRFGPSVEATDALADLYTEERRWPELHDLLADTCRRDRARAARLAARLGDACRLRLDDPAHAVDWYESALVADPRHADAREGLQALVAGAARGAGDGDTTRRRAVAALLAASLETDDWKLRRDLMAPRLAGAGSGPARAAILRETAQICEQRAADKRTALAHTAQALVADPTDRALEAELLRLAEETADFAVPVRALEEAARAADLAPRRATELSTAAGRLHEEKLGDAGAALAAFSRALQAEPGRRELRLCVVRCAGSAARWDALATALLSPEATDDFRETALFPIAEAAARAHDGGAAYLPLAAALGQAAAALGDAMPADAFLRLEGRIAAWHETERNDRDAAEAALVRALDHGPEHLPTLHRLAVLQRRAPSAALYGTLRRIAALSPDDLDALGEATERAHDLPLPDDVALDVSRVLLDRAARLLGTRTAATGTRTAPAAVALAVEEIARRLLGSASIPAAPDAIRAAYDTYLRAADLLAAAGADADLARVFRTRAEELALRRLADRPAAIRALTQILDAEPADDDSIERLAALYETERRFAELAQLRRGQLGRSDSRDRRLDLRLELERVGAAIEGASDRVTLLMANLGEAPGHVPTIDALTRVLHAANRHAQLADTLGAEAEKVENLGERAAAAAIWSRLGKVAEEPLGDRPRAIAAHERAAALVTAAPTLDALGRLSMEVGNADAATRWLDQLLGIAPVGDRPSVALRLGHAYLAIDRRHRAIACLERALAETPSAQAVRALLIDLHRRAGAAAPLAGLLTDAGAFTEDPAELLALALEVNALATGPLGDAAIAVTALERAHRAAPRGTTAAAQAEQTVVVLALAVALLAAARHDDAGEVLEQALGAARRSSERAQLLHHLGRVRRAQGRDVDAVTVFEQAAAIDLGNTGILQDLFAAAGAAGDNERAERAGRALLALARGADPQRLTFSVVEVLLRLRELASARNDDAQAGELLESAMLAAVRDTAEFQRLCTLLRQENALEALASALDKRIAAAGSPAEEAQAYGEAAELREKLGQPEAALEATLRALELRADDPAARSAGRALATRLGLAEKALERVEMLVDRRRRRGDGPLVARLLLWAGELCEEQLRDPTRALGFFRRAGDTGEIPTPAAMAIARAAAACDPAERARALDALARMVREESTPAGQADALFRLAEAELQSPDSRQRGLASLSTAAERAGDMERALALIQSASITEDELGAVLPLYERMARKAGNDRQLLDALARRARTPDATTDSIREGYDLAIALHDDARAEALLAALVTHSAGDDSRSADAVWGLIELGKRCRARGDLERAHACFADALERTDPERLEPLLRELAIEARGAGQNPALAARIYETLRTRAPGNGALWNDLFSLYAELGDLAGCDRMARERLEELPDAATRNEVRMRLTQLRLAADPGDAGALEALRDVLMDDPAHVEAADLLARHYESIGDLAALAEVRHGQLKAFEEKHDTPRVAALAAALGRSLAAGGDVAGGLAAFTRALRVLPGDRTLMQDVLLVATTERTPDEMKQIEALLLAQPGADGFRTARAAQYRAAEQWGSLAAVLADHAAHEKDAIKSSGLLRDAAAITHSRLGDIEKALELAQAARWAAGEDRRSRTLAAQLMAQLLTELQQHSAAMQLLVETLAIAPPVEREQISATISNLRLLAAQPGPDPDVVNIDDLQEITDHG